MKKILKIKNNFFDRNTSLLKLAIKTGTGLLTNSSDPTQVLLNIIGKDPKAFSDELAMYKGSILKAGQLLSLYGEYYLPKEVNAFLENLKGQTNFLDFEVIKKQLPKEVLDSLEIDETPIAAASIGQVHRATLKSLSEKKYVIKIQYSGIEKAISTDIFFIKMLFKSSKILPKSMNMDEVFLEIKKILTLETNYENEALMIKEYRKKIQAYFTDKEMQMIGIPSVVSELSGKHYITMDYLNGVTLDNYCSETEKSELNNVIGATLFKIFLLEIFKISMVQTDAHGGNYLIDVQNKKLNLLDFGACVKYTSDEMDFYRNFISSSVRLQKEKFFETLDNFFKVTQNEFSYDRELLWKYVEIATTPLRSHDFDWGATKIPDQLLELGLELQKSIKAKKVPHQFIFIDRKVVGLFMMLKKLEAKFDVYSIFENVTRDS